MMDRKIPTTLWKTQLLKLVNEAPRAVCVNSVYSGENPCHLQLNDHHNKSDFTNSNSNSSSSASASDTSSQSHQENDDLLFSVSNSKSISTRTTNGDHYHHSNGITNGHSHLLNAVEIEKTESCSSVSLNSTSASYGMTNTNKNKNMTGMDRDPLNLNLNSSLALAPTTSTSSSSSNHIDEVDIPSPFGKAFHGYLTHSQTLQLLLKDGHYLIRKRDNDDEFVLSFRFNGHLKNFQVSYDDTTDVLFIGDRDKAYRSLQELVQEGLTTLYLDQKAGSYIEFMCDLSQFHMNINGTRSNMNNSTLTTNGHSNFYSSHGGRVKSSSPSPTASTVSRSSMERLRNPDLRLHSFLIHTFEGLSRCQICQNFMWGLSSQGLQCKDCGFSIHEGCVEKVFSECEPSLDSVKEVFGADLSLMVKAAGGSKPPFVLEKCITEIEKRGILTEGIYRVSGSRELIERLKTMLEKDREMTDLTQYIDVHSMCGLVKRYLRLLPQPLITPDVFEQFLNANGAITFDLTRRLIKKLPRGHQVTLKYILQHFYLIVQHSESNRMTGYNLSSVFTPTLICSEISLNALKIGTAVLEAMIRFVPKLYPQSSLSASAPALASASTPVPIPTPTPQNQNQTVTQMQMQIPHSIDMVPIQEQIGISTIFYVDSDSTTV